MTKIKKAVAVVAAIMVSTSSAVSALEINTFSEELKVYYEGTDVYADSAEKPIIINDRTMVPLRPIFEAMGWENENITYDDETKTARFEGGDVSCEFTNDSDTAIQYWSDGTTADFLLDVPATIYNDRFYIPLRAFCEIWGQDIEWVNEERSVYVSEADVSAKTYDYAEYMGTWYYAINSDVTEVRPMQIKDLGKNKAEITWDDGRTEIITFVSDDTAKSPNADVRDENGNSLFECEAMYKFGYYSWGSAYIEMMPVKAGTEEVVGQPHEALRSAEEFYMDGEEKLKVRN